MTAEELQAAIAAQNEAFNQAAKRRDLEARKRLDELQAQKQERCFSAPQVVGIAVGATLVGGFIGWAMKR